MNETIVLTPLWVPLVSVFIPLLVALATKSESDNTKRAIVAIAASGALAIAEQVTGDGATVEALIAGFFTAVAAQFVAYKTLWGTVLDINNKALPTRGIL